MSTPPPPGPAATGGPGAAARAVRAGAVRHPHDGRQVYGCVDGPATVTAREALGLDATVPTYGDDSGGGDGSDSGGGLEV